MSYNNKKFSRRALSIAVLAAISSTATYAQNNDAPIEEELIVKGIRQSLIQSMDTKRNAVGVVDAISAEDIGKFPDTNLAESLQRITGVSIDRTNNEGNQVTVRGMGPQFNLVTLNGRQMPNSSALVSEGITRSFNFREVAAESVSGVDVHKTGQAHVSSGGIGATINIKTAKPLNFDGLVAQASIKGVMDRSVNDGSKVTPEFSGMVSQNFGDMFGAMLTFSHAKRDSGIDRIGTSGGWSKLGGDVANVNTDQVSDDFLEGSVFRAITVDVEESSFSRERQNAQLALQYAPMESLTASFDYTMSRLKDEGQMNRMSFWFDNIENGTANANGTLVQQSRSNDELNFWAWEYGFETENNSVGLNVDWQLTETLNLEFDYHDSSSHANPGGRPAERLANLKNEFGARAPVTIEADFSGKLPTVAYDDSALVGGAFALENIEADLYQERGFETENNIKQIQIHGKWENADEGGLRAINFGYASTKYDVDTNNISSVNFGLGSSDANLTPALNIDDLDLTFTSGGQGFEFLPQFSATQFIDLVDDPANWQTRPDDVDPNTTLRGAVSNTLNGISEDTSAYYVSLDFDSDFNGMNMQANIGVRYEETHVESYTVLNPVIGFNWTTPLQMGQIRAEEAVSERFSGSYNNFLPNMDFSLEIVEGVKARMSYSKTIARSNISSMFPATNLGTVVPNVGDTAGIYEASQGDPGLLPYESNNLDFSLEWYYSEGSYVSLGHFRKTVDNYIGTKKDDVVLEGPNGPLRDPSADPAAVCPGGTIAEPIAECTSQLDDEAIVWERTRPVNQTETKVDGLEFNIQQMFGGTGLGVIFNYTMVDSPDKFDTSTLSNGFAITGMSDSANLIAFYEIGDFQARIAYNWRDEFLLRTDGDEPVFTAAYKQFDLSTRYDISDNFSVFFEGINITNEKTHRHGRFENHLYDYEEYGPRYNVGASFKF